MKSKDMREAEEQIFFSHIDLKKQEQEKNQTLQSAQGNLI